MLLAVLCLSVNDCIYVLPCKQYRLFFFFFLMIRHPPRSPLFPSPTLFRPPAVERNVPIHVYNSRRPELSGSLITSMNSSGTPLVKSIAFKRNMAILAVVPKHRYGQRSEEHTSELQSRLHLVCRLLLEKKKK